MDINNVTLKKEGETIHPQTSTDLVHSKVTGEALDTILTILQDQLEQLVTHAITTPTGFCKPFPNGVTSLATFKIPGRFYLTTTQCNALTDKPASAGGFLEVINRGNGDVIQNYIVNNQAGLFGQRTHRLVSSTGTATQWVRECMMVTGSGTPNWVISGNIGMLYIDLSNNDLYIKTTDSSSGGWVRKPL